jgi:hypothetical protein
MSRPPGIACRWMLALVVLLPFGSPAATVGGNADDEEEVARAFAKLEAGMSPEKVRQLVGAPKRIARQILYHRHREQWIYDGPLPIRLTFECPRGQKPRLLAPLRPSVEKNDGDHGAKGH